MGRAEGSATDEGGRLDSSILDFCPVLALNGAQYVSRVNASALDFSLQHERGVITCGYGMTKEGDAALVCHELPEGMDVRLTDSVYTLILQAQPFDSCFLAHHVQDS